jgi:hypothetical protein
MDKFLVNYVVTHPKRRYIRDRCSVNSGFVLHSYSCCGWVCRATICNWRVHKFGLEENETVKCTLPVFSWQHTRKILNTSFDAVNYKFTACWTCSLSYDHSHPNCWAGRRIKGATEGETRHIQDLRSFWNVMQRTVVVPHRRFGTAYRSQLQGSWTSWPLKMGHFENTTFVTRFQFSECG